MDSVLVIEIDRTRPILHVFRAIRFNRNYVIAIGEIFAELLDAIFDAMNLFELSNTLIALPWIHTMDGSIGRHTFRPRPARQAEERSDFNDTTAIRNKGRDCLNGAKLELGDLAGNIQTIRHA
ncbi:hypothetical protein GCM10007973_23380 [Polymorphobacter multimanifer]|nr:hypothetical protein [Polymorphobacter multimanifer]GGI86174.1 hypothetical protein GCM10007973_23380 [Polymorphobacter multimanifer]